MGSGWRWARGSSTWQTGRESEREPVPSVPESPPGGYLPPAWSAFQRSSLTGRNPVKPRSKFLIGGALVLGTAGYLMVSSIEETAQYYLTPTELASKVESNPRFVNTGVKVGARVVNGTIVRDPSGKTLRFRMTDGAREYDVVHRGIIPDTFTDGVDVVVEGRLDGNGTFQSTILLAKCASRYENAPEKYRDTPGYKAAASPRA
jgi:cytochrome c-type biogenesis protein CcmE